jgi:hypothetical protein
MQKYCASNIEVILCKSALYDVLFWETPMKQTLFPALIGITVAASIGLAIADETPQAGVSSSAVRANPAGKTRAQVRAELKANNPTSSQHDHELAQSVTGFAPVSRAKTSP